ncbi:acyltransferase [Larkinella sp. VNQ87]|uniref:acyltransferase n=1 Tax=Larkinella sp. VNQ87 TaxID=3400921 RepID=UPI003C0CDB60
MKKYLQKALFKIRHHYLSSFFAFFRILWFRLLGMRIGKGVGISPIKINWPHQVALGGYCKLEHGIHIKYDRPWQPGPSIIIGERVFIGSYCEFNCTERIIIGNDVNIASGCRFIDHNHGTKLGELIGKQPAPKKVILIGDDVWLGCNVIVLMGVEIGNGAIVGAGAVVTKSILPNEVWAGVPARKIGQRLNV